ncbi:hypothetical protein Vadar_021170 [Vaccinium darrowii]|uniref:Uncharacterized protein n=1 Tax=Vaccinium darrowii TaxID=229202 RepID=A0ACB7XIY4_9ERIC|nr:hypothetical protein Vadar_021170 [Vaccinium darrowii]
MSERFPRTRQLIVLILELNNEVLKIRSLDISHASLRSLPPLSCFTEPINSHSQNGIVSEHSGLQSQRVYQIFFVLCAFAEAIASVTCASLVSLYCILLIGSLKLLGGKSVGVCLARNVAAVLIISIFSCVYISTSLQENIDGLMVLEMASVKSTLTCNSHKSMVSNLFDDIGVAFTGYDVTW